jgi:hypothetical protein
MANTYTWVITAMDSYPQHAGQTDVVFTIHWTLNATDGSGHNASVYGTVGVIYAAGEPFTPYAQLTQQQVIGWVTTSLGAEQVAAYEASLDQQIANQITPPVVTLPLPWSS